VGSYPITQLTRRTGVPASTLRYYENVGLLTPQRLPSGRRSYDEDAVDRLEFIAAAKCAGLPLEDIGSLLRAWQPVRCVTVRDQLAAVIDQHLAAVDNRIAQLSAFADRLAAVRPGLTSSVSDGCTRPCECDETDAYPPAIIDNEK
jgi:DNA-binding transcriptional MerR regulator